MVNRLPRNKKIDDQERARRNRIPTDAEQAEYDRTRRNRNILGTVALVLIGAGVVWAILDPVQDRCASAECWERKLEGSP